MAARPVKVAFLADTKDLQASLKQAEASMDSAAAEAAGAGDKIDRAFTGVADASDGVASASSQAAGGIGDLGGALSMIPGPLGKVGAGMEVAAPAIMGLTGAADLANLAFGKFPILAKIAAGASKALAIAQRVLGVAMRFALGPIGLIIIGLTALIVVVPLVVKNWDKIIAKLKAVWGYIKGVFAPVWKWLKNVVSNAISGVVGIVRGLVSKVGKLFSTAFAFWKAPLAGAFNAVVGFIKGVPGKITALGGKFRQAGSAIMHKIVDGIKSAAGFIGNIASGIWRAVKGMLNQAIGKINSALEFRISLPLGKSISINPPDIPMLANGGIVTRPTLAVIGEAGPEAVVPLNGRYGMGDTYVIKVSVSPTADKASIGREIASALDAYARAGGRRRAA